MRFFGLPRRPLSLCLAALWASVIVGRAVADEPIPDEVKQIINKVVQNETKIKNLSMHIDLTRTWNEMKTPDGNRVDRKISLTETVDSSGRCREEGTGQLLLGMEAASYKLIDGTVRTVFDGTSALKLQEIANPKGQKRWIGRYVDAMVWAGVDPREAISRIDGQPASEILAKTHVDKSTFKWFEGSNVTVLETAPVQYDGPDGNRGMHKHAVWIAPHLGYAMVHRANLVQVSPDEPWQEYFYTGGGNYKEIAPGIFLPSTIYQEDYNCLPEGRRTFIYQIEGQVTEWKVNQDLPADTFTLAVPEGAKVFDERKKPDGQ